jgi:AhpD family alkylhydroperoxidase
MFFNRNHVRHAVAAAAIGLSIVLTVPAIAQEAPATPEAAYAEMMSMLGVVPGFVDMYPKAGVAGIWHVTRDLLFAESALDMKTKALISLAVAAQIPCQYCIWSDTRDALAAGATEEQVHEAVAIAALTRHWSTIFNGYQIDFDTYKRELGGE